MKSFGLWYKRTEQSISEHNDENHSSQPIISLHVNFWSLEDIKTQDAIKRPYLDIGIKIENYRTLDQMFFYCPFAVKKENIYDLSDKLASKNNAGIIFNKDCEIQTKDSYTIIELLEGQKQETLLIFPLNQVIDQIFAIERCKNGNSQIVFQFENFIKYVDTIKQLKDINTLYIRFRIKSIELKDKIYFDSKLANWSFESAFSGTRIIDFKVNEKRNIDDEIKASIIVKGQEWAELKTTHFLVMEPSSYDLTSFFEEKMTCRELEEHLWDDYLGTKINFRKGHILAYHWKGEKTFSCLVKVKYSRANFATIAIYCAVVILLSLASSVLFEAGVRCLGLS